MKIMMMRMMMIMLMLIMIRIAMTQMKQAIHLRHAFVSFV